MTFSSASQNTDSARFVLVSVSPRRLLTAGATNLGGNLYQFDLPEYVNADSVTVNGSAATFTRGATTITISSGSDLTDLSNYTILTHTIYLTTERHRVTESVAGLPDAQWEPRILEEPTVSQSVRDLTEGTFSLASTNIVFASTDRLGQVFAGVNDSYSNADCVIWSCVDTLENNELIFNGVVVSASNNYEGKFSLSVIDSFNKLNNTATFGDKDQAFLYTTGSNYPNPNDENTPIPLIFGEKSPVTIQQGWRHVDAYGNMLSNCYHIVDGLKAKKVSPQTPDENSTITFLCGRILSEDIRLINFGAIVSSATHTFSRVISTAEGDTAYITQEILYIDAQFTTNCDIGDYIPSINGRKGWICAIARTGHLYSSFNVAIALIDYGENTNGGPGTPPSDTFVAGPAPTFSNSTYPSMSLWVQGGDGSTNDYHYVPLALVPFFGKSSQDTRYLPFSYSLGAPQLIGGEYIRNVYATINPSTANLVSGKASNSIWSRDIRFRYTANGEAKTYGFQALSMTLKAAGMTPNAASFSAADGEDSTNMLLAVPFKDSTYPKYLDVIQLICKSLFCILRINNDREVEVVRIKNTTSLTADITRDATDIINGEMAGTVDYQDIYDTAQFQNPEINDVDSLSGTGTIEFIVNGKSAQLNGVSRVKSIDHCLKTIQSQAARIAGYLSAASVEYTLSTASKDLPTLIGDIAEITNVVAFGESQTVKAMVVSKDSKSGMTTLKLREIRGVP